jgi:hypothetical protein
MTMKTRTKYAIEATTLGALAAGSVALLERRRRSGWSRGSRYGKLFDPAASLRLEGFVSVIGRVKPLPGMSDGALIILKTGQERVPVQLGPARYITVDDFLSLGDEVEITGSPALVDGETVIIAEWLQAHGRTVYFRDPQGRPLWRSRTWDPTHVLTGSS